jgi:hypothetical protein
VALDDGNALVVGETESTDFPSTRGGPQGGGDAFVARIRDGSIGPTPTRTPPRPGVCPGDCGGDGRVTVDELVAAVAVLLGHGGSILCDALDLDGDGRLALDEVVLAVARAMFGCQGPLPTATRTPTAAPTATPTVDADQSVCGGPVTSEPKVCNLRVIPPRVRRGARFSLSFGVSDLESNIEMLCFGFGPESAAPQFNCVPAGAEPAPLNRVFEFEFPEPIPNNAPLGRFTAAVRVIDASGTQRETTTTFEIFNIRV